MPRAPRPTCCSPSARRPGRTCWCARCWPSNCGAPPASLRTIPIIAQADDMMRRILLSLLAVAAVAAGGLAFAQTRGGDEARALATAKREAEEAMLRSRQLEREAAAATSEAARARAEAAALAARIEASEADITAAETRVRFVERIR